ncbi:MAG TPA: hypothetical protein VH518_06940, partial [Tepidisphaeraceae bacterium]
MLSWQWSYVLLVGTAVALLGFVRWPRSSYELIHPRFVVPGIIWLATFGQAMFRSPETWRAEFYEAARIEYGNASLWYTILAILCFFLGLIMPFGRWMSQPFVHLETQFRVDPVRIRKIAWIGTWSLFAFFFLVAGPRALGISSAGALIPISPSLVRFATIILSVGSVFNAVMLGVSWPEPGQRTAVTYVMMIVGLFVNSMYTMPVFSRGAGLAVFVAAMAYSIRVRRFRLIVMIPAILWVALCAYTGLVGRGIHGRDSDVPTFISTLVTYGLEDPVSVLRSGCGLNDSFTALAMSMKAITRADVRPLTKLDWLIFQLPIPHWWDWLPTWTLDLTLYIGGYGSWGYTVGILGDTYIHWGWWGPLWFVPIGILYRLVADLSFNAAGVREGGVREGGISAYSLLLFSGYWAIGMGVFNTYRAFVVGFILPATLICIFLFLRKMFFRPDAGYYQQVMSG